MKRFLAVSFLTALVMPAASLAQGGRPAVQCEPGNGGLTLPSGFCGVVVADNVGAARHLVVSRSGDIYVAIRNQQNAPGGVVALRDTNGDGRADVQERFGDSGGTGIQIYNNYLYVSRDDAVVRFPMKEGQLSAAGPAEVVVSGFPQQRVHPTKTLVFDNRGGLYVNVGNASNACTEPDQAKAAGLNPCTHQVTGGGVWRFDANRAGQVHGKDGTRYSSGLRQANAMAWHPTVNALYLAQHGRNGLNRWPEYFSDEQQAETPAEELQRIDEGANHGFPYCYYDRLQGKRVQAPEYGGDGKQVGDCAKYPLPVAAFPAHWAPNDLLIYTGSQFGQKYSGGVFIAFHGSGSRTPLPQGGYSVVFQPLRDGKAAGNYEVFANGFAGRIPMKREEADARPVGLAEGPDGSLYIVDSVKGKLWRVISRGAAASSN
jgi:glucose/arabinose dehydrogenase